jgi:hypothetical protein
VRCHGRADDATNKESVVTTVVPSVRFGHNRRARVFKERYASCELKINAQLVTAVAGEMKA